jgi:uncharacterized protein YhfF
VSERTPLPPYELGFAGTEMRRRLVDLVLRGEKTSTASLRAMYQPFTTDPLPRAGERFVLVGHADEPCGTVEVTRVEVVPLGNVSVQFAIAEGEGYTSAEDWRVAGLRYWGESGYEVTGATLVVCEWFRLV